MRGYRLYLAFLAAAVLAAAQNPPAAPQKKGAGRGGDLGFEDTPMLPDLPYHVHDPNRPHPRVVTPGAQPGAAPSDAVMLFDGRDLSNWMSASLNTVGFRPRPEPTKWKVENGYMETAPGALDLATKEKFGSVQLHVEWAAPAEARGSSQGRGNSGVFLQGLYEVQILDSYENVTYADGQAGAIYGQWPPLVNSSRKPGEWQVYDIVFEAPKFEGQKMVTPAYLTVFHNGVVIHNRKAAIGQTVYRRLPTYAPQTNEDSIVLQNHGNPTRFRNIWVRRLGGYDEPEKK